MNYFAPKSSAERYAIGRPDFHSNTIFHLSQFLKLTEKLNNVLDVACGTGLSTKALLPIANNVFGTDISEQMLNFACVKDKVTYVLAPAEIQPFPSNMFDLITVSSGVHWFDIDAFLQEVQRLLKDKAWLVLYENYFISEMEDSATFRDWFPDVYLKNFPSPPRNSVYNWDNNNLQPKNLALITEERFKNSVTLNKKQLALYFTTQSNIVAAVENGTTTYEEVENWLDKELQQFFKGDSETKIINYGNWIKYIQKTNSKD